jgi:cytochrome P450
MSQVPWTIMFCSGKSHRRLSELHEKYGNIVRIGPNELSYIEPEAWESIMGRFSGVENPKAPWYSSPDYKDIVGARMNDHTRMRRLLSYGFSSGAMAKQYPMIKGHVDLLIQRLHQKSQGSRAAIEISSWYNYCIFDIGGDLALGEAFGCLQESVMHPWIALVFATIRTVAIGIALNRFPFLRRILPLIVPKKLRQQAAEFKKLSRDKISKRLESGGSRPDILGVLISSKGELVRISLKSLAECISC